MKIKQKTKLVVCGLALACGLSGMAYAQDNTQADSIKTAISRYIADLKQRDAQTTLHTEGEVLVEHNKMYYAVTLPDISFVMGGMGRFDVGNVVANVAQNDRGNWRISMAFPQTMTWKQENGDISGLVSFGKQDITGTWNSGFEFFSNLNAEINDLRFVDRVNRMDVAARLAKRNLVINKQGERSSTVTSTANLYDVNGRVLGQGIEFTANQMAFSMKHSGVQLTPYIDTLKTLLVDGQGWTTDTLMNLSDSFANGEQSLTMTGLRYNGGEGGLNGTIGAAKFSNTIETQDSGYKNYGISAEWSGITPSDKAVPVFPKTLFLKAGLLNVNKEELTKIVSSLSSAQDSDKLGGLLEALGQTTGTLDVDGFEMVMNNGSRFTVSGAFSPNPNSPRKWAGKMQLSITGMEQFTQDLAKVADEFTQEKAQKLRMMVMQLQMATVAMQAMGTGGRSASGQTVISLDLELTPEGKMLINGQEAQMPLGNMLGAAGAAQDGQNSIGQDVAPE